MVWLPVFLSWPKFLPFLYVRCNLPKYNIRQYCYHKIQKCARNDSGICEKIATKLGNLFIF